MNSTKRPQAQVVPSPSAWKAWVAGLPWQAIAICFLGVFLAGSFSHVDSAKHVVEFDYGKAWDAVSGITSALEVVQKFLGKK